MLQDIYGRVGGLIVRACNYTKKYKLVHRFPTKKSLMKTKANNINRVPSRLFRE